MTNNELIWIIFLLPLSSFLINGTLLTFTKFNTKSISGPLNVLTIGFSFLICLFILNLKDLNSNYNFEIFRNNIFINNFLDLTNDKVLKNCYCMLIGYFFTSVLDMSYMCPKNNFFIY